MSLSTIQYFVAVTVTALLALSCSSSTAPPNPGGRSDAALDAVGSGHDSASESGGACGLYGASCTSGCCNKCGTSDFCTCSEDGQRCSSRDDCCGVATCTGGTCHVTGCAGSGELCAAESDCCTGLTCRDDDSCQ